MTTEQEVRNVLDLAQRTGMDPYLALQRARLLWDDGKVLRIRTDTLRAAAQAVRDKPVSSYPHTATASAGQMRDFLIGFLHELADLQEVQRAKNEGGHKAV